MRFVQRCQSCWSRGIATRKHGTQLAVDVVAVLRGGQATKVLTLPAMATGEGPLYLSLKRGLAVIARSLDVIQAASSGISDDELVRGVFLPCFWTASAGLPCLK